MTSEARHGVWLYDHRIGVLHQRGDHVRLTLSPDYWADSDRAVLGLRFEDMPSESHASSLRLPPWFSNLLPEGRLREWIAGQRGVSPHREMELLAEIGHDLPGAVRVFTDSEDIPSWAGEPTGATGAGSGSEGSNRGWRFSLAGVALKFSMLERGERLTLPAGGAGGDWIVKLPDASYPGVPRNEYVMMRWAGAAGISVPEVRLYDREQLDDLPDRAWAGAETEAYAVRRFDRDAERKAIHIEDLAQVRNFYPEDKYRGSFESVAAYLYRGRDVASLREFARRLAFFIMIGNGDAHLKNWSLIYPDRRVPTLSPAYDIVSTAPYHALGPDEEDLGLKFGGSRRFEAVTVRTFKRLQERLGAHEAGLPEVVEQLVRRTLETWPDHAQLLEPVPMVREWLQENLVQRARGLGVSLV